MDDHLGYEKSEHSDNDDYRNGYKRKQVNSRYGSMEIEMPQDRKSTFEPQVVKKRQKDIEYSRAMKSHFRKFGNQMSGSGNHLCNYASLLA